MDVGLFLYNLLSLILAYIFQLILWHTFWFCKPTWHQWFYAILEVRLVPMSRSSSSPHPWRISFMFSIAPRKFICSWLSKSQKSEDYIGLRILHKVLESFGSAKLFLVSFCLLESLRSWSWWGWRRTFFICSPFLFPPWSPSLKYRKKF